MEITVEISGIRQGSISYESIPAFLLFVDNLGFETSWDSSQTLQLKPRASSKKVALSHGSSVTHSHRKRDLESLILKEMEGFLVHDGIEVTKKKKRNKIANTDLQMMVEVLEDKNAAKTQLDLSYTNHDSSHTWLDSLQRQVEASGFSFCARKKFESSSPQLQVTIRFPKKMETSERTMKLKQASMILTMGVLAYMNTHHPLSSFSLIPFNELSSFLSPPPTEIKDTSKTASHESNITSLPAEEMKIIEAEAYFDYHVLLHKEDSSKVKIMGSFHLKNTGTEALQNPVICFRISPVNSVKISGQILPPNVVETKGVQGDYGSKGWRYLNDSWHKEIQEKGEVWICPVHSLQIQPGHFESFQNIQMTLLQPEEHDKVSIQGFVFFNDNDLQIEANNQVSLSF
ncbi:hypothetical protein AS034_00605 [[Bacillus] enclensis]|uniref:Uncharacterized protein n=1 Tax=[Bacillus] enclensis TaxID=1402860 RepID=A0A0V8HP65_9BACI|nr:hypothetical protein [[Bacillus] enclensis]KSU64377.1 hypothetical protein AS034_00605 [[Bacillus] enclensis]SCB73159.1 hypothetical protein GA0061094_0126 [[Bacillus] enclensis]